MVAHQWLGKWWSPIATAAAALRLPISDWYLLPISDWAGDGHQLPLVLLHLPQSRSELAKVILMWRQRHAAHCMPSTKSPILHIFMITFEDLTGWVASCALKRSCNLRCYRIIETSCNHGASTWNIVSNRQSSVANEWHLASLLSLL